MGLEDALFREPAQRVLRDRHRRAFAFSHAPPLIVGFYASPIVNIHAAGVNCHIPGKLGREYLQVIAAAGRKPTTEGKRWTYTWI
jgi:hypothetical protein